MKLRIDEVATGLNLNMSQVQRQTGLTTGKIFRYWHNQSGSVELEALETLWRFFQKHDPSIQLADLFKID